jgi:hypothetical protein
MLSREDYRQLAERCALLAGEFRDAPARGKNKRRGRQMALKLSSTCGRGG